MKKDLSERRKFGALLYQTAPDSGKSESCHCQPHSNKSRKSLLLLLAGIVFITIVFFSLTRIFDAAPVSFDMRMSYGLIFVTGLLTGFHCVGMCGGFVLSYTANDLAKGSNPFKSHLLYAGGKTLSYTFIGAILGFAGAVISFTTSARSVVGIIAGLLLILLGLKTLGIFPQFKRLRLRRFFPIAPRSLNVYRRYSNPLILGILNGLMIICGPLQAMYLLAAESASPSSGAAMLFIFGLGTLPVMLGLGYFTSYVSLKVRHQITILSGLIIILFGLSAINGGLLLAGNGYDFNSIAAKFSFHSNKNVEPAPVSSESVYQIIEMKATHNAWSPNKFVLKKGVPVRWIINGDDISLCTRTIEVPSLELKLDLKPGKNIIEFTPAESGTITWSCWMGMASGVMEVNE